MRREFLEELLTDEAVIDAILSEHGRTVAELNFTHTLQQAVTEAGGRNLTAIRAMLDEQTLKAAADPTDAVRSAVTQLRREHGYLFRGTGQPYSGGMPASMGRTPDSRDLAAMSMDQYRRYRQGGHYDG